METNKSFIMADRLKQLREAKKLSHEKLSKTLSGKYGIKISSDSLMNYEVSEENHSKSYKNLGMRVEYLYCLADFYGVSADWILGISDVKSPDANLRAVVEYTGMSGRSIMQLHDLPLGLRDIADDIIAHPSFHEMLWVVARARALQIQYSENEQKIAQIEENADGEIIAAQDYLHGCFIESMPYDLASELYLENAKSILGRIIRHTD